MSEDRENGFTISTDPSKLDLDAVHAYLSQESYWARGIPKEVVARSLRHSLCFGVYDGHRQIGFARVVSDFATYAYLCDVFILEGYRGRGLAKRLLERIMSHTDLQGLRRFALTTRDAHGLYEKFGFAGLRHPDAMMEILRTGMYTKARAMNPD